MLDASTRCAVHPSRPAVDECPVCQRPRCAADTGFGSGCVACGGERRVAGPRPLDLRALVGAGVWCSLAIVPLAGITSEYVGASYFQYIVPFLLGLVLGIVAEAGARHAHGLPLRLLTVGFALLGVAYSFFFVPGHPSSFTPVAEVLPAYVAGAAGAWLWTAPPRRVARRDDEQAAGNGR